MAITTANPYDIFSWQAQRNHALYDQMRIEDPVHVAIHPETGNRVWFLTRYDDCLEFLKDKRFGRDLAGNLPPELVAKWEDHAEDSLINQHMLVLDEPAHGRLKSLVHLAFTPIGIAQLRERFQVIADDLFDHIDADVGNGEEFDLTKRYIEQMPLKAIAELLGIPTGDYARFHRWTLGMLSTDRHLARRSIAEFSDYLDQQMALRQQQSPLIPDLLSGLIFAESDGSRLNRQELLAMVYLLVTAGYETMVNFITHSIFTLFEHPEQMSFLRQNSAQPETIRVAIEELLRYTSPSHMTLASWAFEDVVIGSKIIHKGDAIHAVLLAANHDPLVFEDPHRLNLLRQPNRHIAFSHGIHHCLGAALARMQGDIALTTLLRRIPNL